MGSAEVTALLNELDELKESINRLLDLLTKVIEDNIIYNEEEGEE